jgi:hypothetical protein
MNSKSLSHLTTLLQQLKPTLTPQKELTQLQKQISNTFNKLSLKERLSISSNKSLSSILQLSQNNNNLMSLNTHSSH